MASSTHSRAFADTKSAFRKKCSRTSGRSNASSPRVLMLTPMASFVAESPRAAQDAMEAQVVETWQPYVRDGRTPVDQPMVLATGARS